MLLAELKTAVLSTMTKDAVRVFGPLTHKATWVAALESIETAATEVHATASEITTAATPVVFQALDAILAVVFVACEQTDRFTEWYNEYLGPIGIQARIVFLLALVLDQLADPGSLENIGDWYPPTHQVIRVAKTAVLDAAPYIFALFHTLAVLGASLIILAGASMIPQGVTIPDDHEWTAIGLGL